MPPSLMSVCDVDIHTEFTSGLVCYEGFKKEEAPEEEGVCAHV